MKFRGFPLLLVAILALNLMLPAVYAQIPIGLQYDTRTIMSFILGKPVDQIPSDWLMGPNYVLNFIFYLLLPFFAIVAVIYGIMYDLRIFRHGGVRMALSLTMAGMTLPTGWLLSLVFYFYSFNAAFAAIMFGVVFFVGILFWGIGKMGYFLGQGRFQGAFDIGKQRRGIVNQIDREILALNTGIADLEQKAATSGGLSSGEEHDLEQRRLARDQAIARKKDLMNQPL